MPGLVIPLANFEMEIAQIDLGDGWEIRPLGHDDLTHIGTNFYIAQHFSPMHHKDMTYALAQKVGPNEDPPSLDPRLGIDIIRSLKLLHAGDISTPLYFYNNRTKGQSVSGGLFSAKHIGVPYRLLSSDIDDLRRILAAIIGIRNKDNQQIENALSRFDDACSRTMTGDPIVDCFTALESCLTPDGQAEIGFRLALRVAALLVGFKQAVYVRELMKVGYDVRSKMVHGGAQFHKLFSDSKFIRKLRPLKVAMDVDPDLPCITSTSFSSDVVECTRTALRVVVLSMATKYASCDELVADLDRRLAAALEASGTVLP